MAFVMAKHWDSTFRKLIRTDPHAFLKWVLPEATLIKQLPDKLSDVLIEVDALIHARLDNNEEVMVNLEIQTYNDPKMAERLLRYNVLIRTEYDIPVMSIVIHLLDDGEIAISPLIWTVPNEQKVLEFHYQSIELSKLTPEDILATGLIGLYPLLPLTKGGTKHEVVEGMFSILGETGKTELELVGFTLASFAFTRLGEIEQNWLIRRFHEMHDILHDTPIYQLILKEGREEGLETGFEEGLERGLLTGRLEALRQTLVNVVQIRYPKLVKLAKAQAAMADDPDMLNALIVKLVVTQSASEAKLYLLDFDEDEDDETNGNALQ